MQGLDRSGWKQPTVEASRRLQAELRRETQQQGMVLHCGAGNATDQLSSVRLMRDGDGNRGTGWVTQCHAAAPVVPPVASRPAFPSGGQAGIDQARPGLDHSRITSALLQSLPVPVLSAAAAAYLTSKAHNTARPLPAASDSICILSTAAVSALLCVPHSRGRGW